MRAVVKEKSIGWAITKEPVEGLKLVEECKHFTILENLSGKKVCVLKGIPRLSFEEELLLHRVSETFQKNPGKPSDSGLRKFFRAYCVDSLILLEKQQVEYLLILLEKQVFGFGPLDFLLEDQAIEEIAVIGIGNEKPVYVFHCKHGWMKTNFFFSSAIHLKDLVNKMARSIGRRISLNNPVLNATLPNGSRLSATIRPVSFTGPSLTIRRFKKEPFAPVQLVENQTFSKELMAFLWIAMQCDCSLLISGNTGSGKTSSLNALLSFVPCNERIVVVEETPEIMVRHKHFVKLNVVREQSIGMQELIVESLRMRPDRILVGEVRSREEVSAFIDTMLAGQGKGSYATFHAQTAEETANRMRSLGVLEIDLAAVNLVLVQRRWNVIRKNRAREVRRIVEVVEFFNERGKLCSNTLFKFDYGKDRLVKANESKIVFEKAKRSFGFNKKGWKNELSKRAKFIGNLIGKGIEFEEFFKKVNEY